MHLNDFFALVENAAQNVLLKHPALVFLAPLVANAIHIAQTATDRSGAPLSATDKNATAATITLAGVDALNAEATAAKQDPIVDRDAIAADVQDIISNIVDIAKRNHRAIQASSVLVTRDEHSGEIKSVVGAFRPTAYSTARA